MIDGKGSEAMIGYGPESKVPLNPDGSECMPGVIHMVKKGELGSNPIRPFKGDHVNILWEVLRGVAHGSMSCETALAAIELSRRIEEIQNS